MYVWVCSSWWESLTEPPCRHANGGGCSVGAVEHRRWHLWLLPHQRNRGQDPHTGKCPLYPSVCDCLPVCWPDTPHDLYTMEKTLIGTELRNLVLSQAPWGRNSPFTRQQDYLDMRCPHLNKAGPQLLKFLWNLISDALPFQVCYCVLWDDPTAVWCGVKSADHNIRLEYFYLEIDCLHMFTNSSFA